MSNERLARELGISEHAVALYRDCDVIDLHIDTFIWRRLFGYDLHKRHGLGPLRGWFMGHADIPRVIEAEVGGAYWIITTQPLRSAEGRARALAENIRSLRRELEGHEGVALVASYADYRAARARGKHAAFLGIQGGNALDSIASVRAVSEAGVSLVTLLHFTRSPIGAPQLPAHVSREPLGLRPFGMDLVRELDAQRVIVDLSHLHARGFWDVVHMRDRGVPLVASHAAASAIRPHFRNLDDDQLRAIAASGGVVGIIFNAGFLTRSLVKAHVHDVVVHIRHMLQVMGDDHVCLGSDFDGAIIPPRDLQSVLALPRLVHGLLVSGVAERSVRKILGDNFLRVLRAVRPQ